MPVIGAVRQVALASGRNLDFTLAFWNDVLRLPTHARFDPPGIAFIMAGDVRLYFGDGIPPGTVYLDVADLAGFHRSASATGVPFTTVPTLVHVDTHGQFGAAGESEWMAFLKDPAGNTVGLVERLPA
jgi:hypothetical protein